MKNYIKKLLCTALAVVSLSTLVAAPSTFNKSDSDNAVVNIIEANADDLDHLLAYKYVAFITPGKNYYTRRNPWKNDNIYPIEELSPNDKNGKPKRCTQYEWDCSLWDYKEVYVYEERGNWVRVSPDDETYNGKKRERWVYKPRIQRTKPGSQDGHNHSHTDYAKKSYAYSISGWKRNQYVCTYCGKRWNRDK